MEIDKIKQRLRRALIERNQLFPQRNELNDAEVNEALSEFVRLVNRLQKNDFVPDRVLLHKVETVLDAPLFLCGSMKSGTTLLLELLDNHSELITLPGDSFFWGKLWKNNPPSPDQLLAEWDRWLKRMLNPTGQEPFWVFGEKVRPYIEFRQYLDYWYKQLPEKWRSIAISVLFSYYCANPVRPSEPKAWVEKTPGNEAKVAELIRNFPNARFVHIVRDPRENMASLKKLFATRGWQWEPMGIADTLARSCSLADENQQQLGRERYHVLTYEALTENPQQQMAEIADYIGVGWEDSLLCPTVNALPAHANSMYKDRLVTGQVGRATKGKWKVVLTKSEQRAALATLPEAGKMGYAWSQTKVQVCLLILDKMWAKISRAIKLNS